MLEMGPGAHLLCFNSSFSCYSLAMFMKYVSGSTDIIITDELCSIDWLSYESPEKKTSFTDLSL